MMKICSWYIYFILKLLPLMFFPVEVLEILRRLGGKKVLTECEPDEDIA